jgi:hypothetical protein
MRMSVSLVATWGRGIHELRNRRAGWQARPSVRNVGPVKKILGVAIVGALLLFVVLRYASTDKTSAIGPDPAATAATPAPTLPPPPPTPVEPPAATAAVPPAPAASPAAPASVAASDTAACARLADLCSTSDQKVDATECQKQLADARKMAGPGNVDRSEQCLTDAKTCAAASGCLSGGVGMGAMGEFLKGLGGALSR